MAADEHSFDIVSMVDLQEVTNSVNQATKEIEQRFDFKGSKSELEFNRDKAEITLISDDEQKMKNVIDVLQSKLVKRSVSLKSLQYGKIAKASGNTVRQIVSLQQGIVQDKAKEIVKAIKDLKMKVQAEIQKDQVRVRAKKIDDLQTVISMLKEQEFDIDMEFINFR
jgi:uncharacterized protein YajQ (UPF0234 family)